MRIGPPSITHQKNHQILSASIAVKKSGVNCPESIWFAAEGEGTLFLPDLADSFVVGLVASAMYLAEDIWVEGMVSTRLAHGLETYQSILNTWWPGIFKRVDIHYESLVDRRQDLRPKGVGCTFSGGLDSYHAVLQMLPSRVKYSGFSITHALMINGFDQLYDPERQGTPHTLTISSSLMAHTRRWITISAAINYRSFTPEQVIPGQKKLKFWPTFHMFKKV